MAQWCFLLARTSKGEKKQQGLTIFLVPMDDPAIEVRPDPLHDGPAPPQRGVLRRPAGHRGRRARHRRRGLVGRAGGAGLRAGRHRPLRPLRAAAASRARGARRRGGTTCPRSCAAGGPACSTHCRRARLLAYRVVSSCRAADGCARRRRRVPHRGHQARPGQRGGADGHRGRGRRDDDPRAKWFLGEVEDHWRYSQAATVSSGSIEMQRILLSRALLAAAK